MSVTGSCPSQALDEPHAARPHDLSERAGWQSAAACAGLPPRVVFSKKAKEAAPALRACGRCTVRRECEAAVAPADSWFDGVCAGRLWRSGRPAPLPTPTLRPATAHRGGSVA